MTPEAFSRRKCSGGEVSKHKGVFDGPAFRVVFPGGADQVAIHKLIEILRRLSEGGNTVVVIEHNLDVIKTADYIIDIGPEGGDKGGTVIAKGTPEEVAESPVSYTGKYVKRYLGH